MIPFSSMIDFKSRRQEILPHAGVRGAEGRETYLGRRSTDKWVEGGERRDTQVMAVPHNQPSTCSCHTHRSGRPREINFISRYICFSQIGPFDVCFEELFSKVQNPGGFFRKIVF